jgi:hypothetical protein
MQNLCVPRTRLEANLPTCLQYNVHSNRHSELDLLSASSPFFPAVLVRDLLSVAFIVCFLTNETSGPVTFRDKKVYSQRRQVLLGETVFLITPLVKVHAGMIAAGDSAKKCHTVLGSTITSPHHVATATRRGCPIHSRDSASSIFSPVIRYV